MRVLFPKNTDLDDIKLGYAPIERFINGGVYQKDLYGKRIFYVVEPNVFNRKGDYNKQLKIGISNSPISRLQNYRNYFGENTLKNEYSGVHVRLILSTNKDKSKDVMKSQNNYAVATLEDKLKRDLKKSKNVIRGTEWLQIDDDMLLDNIQKALPNNKKDKVTYSPYNTRSKIKKI